MKPHLNYHTCLNYIYHFFMNRLLVGTAIDFSFQDGTGVSTQLFVPGSHTGGDAGIRRCYLMMLLNAGTLCQESMSSFMFWNRWEVRPSSAS